MTTGPLAGVRILDLTTVLMGPFATQILAGLGAEVIKVEPPEGDGIRHIGPMRNPGMGHIFLHVNRGKRSVALDLKQPAARDALLRLAQTADAMVSNVRPAAMRRLGLDYDAVAARNPRIVYVTCCGFGQRGPAAAKPAYDDLIQGAAGVPWLMQQAGAPAPAYAPVTLVDRSDRAARGLRGVGGAVRPRENRQGPGDRGADVRGGGAVRPRRSPRRAHVRPADRPAGLRAAPERRTAGHTRRGTAICAC